MTMQTHFPDDVFQQFARITSALASPSRLKLLDRLCQGEQTVEQLAAGAELSVPNASRQLRILAEAQLASVRRDPPRVYYSVAGERVIQFWFALRELASEQLSELDRIVDDLFRANDGLTPVTREELLAGMDAGDMVLIDVRPASEFQAGHIPGAISVPLEDLESRLASLPPGLNVVAYCRGPYCVLSVDAVAKLRAHGISAARLEDGLPEWRAQGLPVETG